VPPAGFVVVGGTFRTVVKKNEVHSAVPL